MRVNGTGSEVRRPGRGWYLLPCVCLAFLALAVLPLRDRASAGYCLAGQCHASIIAKEYLHGPVGLEKQARGGCELCHIPNGRSCTFTEGGRFTFALSWDKLCMSCHGGTITPDHKLPARPCVICHDPHGSNFSKKLFRRGIVHDGK